ncbi:D-2-hydroxyacid dehydrogenase [Antrihabitans sp. YC3-6]|uniref:D-2-hydroxyacid dehydrogenase n=1 Tax=Antrihabitans stalagmiti TaxID=2799499 RepID=A0A934NTG8_9NOCA|nr:D-2-hydroxyacid dehydrogenase [Antrihabitans stalagmiti]MBJ8341005.1 D-2-hydroxyacid dehydrogenase [Antrihabitans stalagmiti]
MARKPVVVVLHADVLPSGMDAVAAVADVRYATADTLAENLSGADVLLVWDFFSTALRTAWSEADSLRWVHVAAAGVDSLLFDELVESDVLVTNSRGVFDRPIAEFVLATILGFAKDVSTSVRLQDTKQWRHRETESIAGTSVLVVGTGAIGRETARLLTAVGMQVAGSGRVGADADADFGVVHASSDLKSVVEEFDYVVLLAPLTAATRGMVDAGVLAAMKSTARLVNVGRGELVVTDDLVEALQTRSIAGAALDVFDTEPLPADHPLWQLDSVVITPHMSGDAVGWRDRLAELFVANFERYVGGKELANIVDKTRGY